MQAVSQHLDLPRLRESMKVQLVAASAVELSRHKSRALQIAGAVASVLASDKVVDIAVTPDVILGMHVGFDIGFGPDQPIFYFQLGSAWFRP